MYKLLDLARENFTTPGPGRYWKNEGMLFRRADFTIF
jgi:hypothetical protein